MPSSSVTFLLVALAVAAVAAAGVALWLAFSLRRLGGTAAGPDPDAVAAIRELRDNVLQLKQAVETNRSSMADSLRDLRTESGNAQRTQRQELAESLAKQRQELADTLRDQDQRLQARVNAVQEAFSAQRLELTEALAGQRRQFTDSLDAIHKGLNERLQEMQATNQLKLDEVRDLSQRKLDEVREVSQKKLDEIRGVVDEKLNATSASVQSQLVENFKQITELLGSVHKDLGLVQNLATDMTGLRRSLEGVKSRGVFGEVMLGSLLEEFLVPAQFVRNFRPSSRSNHSVEFAVKLPGKDPLDPEKAVFLPIDAKFPKEDYDRLLAALEAGEREEAARCRGELVAKVKSFARDIRDKYVKPPTTTTFAVLYLPVESLFAEVVREPGLLETVQRDFHVTIASPTTLAAYLTALRMGFSTLEVQRNHVEIEKTLSVVRASFQAFQKKLAEVLKRLDKTRDELTETVKSTGKIDKKLRSFAPASPQAVAAMLPAGAQGESETAALEEPPATVDATPDTLESA